MISDMKDKARNRGYAKELTDRERNEQDLAIARARRGMLEEDNQVRKELDEERNKIKNLVPRSKVPERIKKAGSAVLLGIREFKSEMDESRNSRLNPGKKKQGKKSSTEAPIFGSSEPFR